MENIQLIETLRTSIAPAVLISGFGLILLSMTNRLGRIIDRIRVLNAAMKQASSEDKTKYSLQINILLKRCHLLQSAIALVSFGIFLVSVTALLLFSVFLFPDINFAGAIQISFTASLICLILSLFFFMLDIRVTLQSIKIEIGHSDHS